MTHTTTLRRRRRLVPLLILGLLAAACSGGAGESTTTTTGAPDDDRNLVVYAGRSESLVAPIIERFEQESGIDVDVRYAGSGELATTILQEGASSPADVFYAQDPAWIGAVALEGLLTTLPDDVREAVPARFSDDEGRWVGVTARSRVFVYNPELVGEDELPESVWDLTDPTWSGRVGLAPTNASFVAFVSGMLLLEGEDRTREWLTGMAANDPVIFDGNGPIVRAADAGDLASGLVNHYYLLGLIRDQGDATAVNHFFGDGDPGALVMPTGVGALAAAANPEEALEFIRFLIDEESQRYFLEEVSEYPVVSGIGTPTDQTPLEELPALDISLSELGTVIEQATDLIAEAGLT